MANTIILPYTFITNPLTSKRYHLRRSTTINTKQKVHSTSSDIVHNLPDVVNDCHNRCNDIIKSNNEMKLICKEIAHSLRLVADQVDKKYCQDDNFNRDLYCLSIRLVFHTTHIRTILYTLWTRTFLPFILLICKTKRFF
ncbi:unnamed protein product [Rotaria sordida]|uniref:Uncharacterized protein n=1 Tax=Rotaria sordida TaxID=392033 RepID=A0A813ZVT4_9BILA|nr:unnamed protein product [Rotaria sordida]CAF0904809.1 unnamed protein product [Rotaria sordida]CAF3641372.1 unnamed protein product [Rotaria sordida]CAF3690726.1 unnamed protein product [Rotaria sordida]